jgi:glutamyl-tRNA synthetase
MAQKVVTRFAPSPTGYMHVGGVRTAIYAWLFARKNSGTFILRIEDTDKAREVEGSIEHIKESLGWLGIDWDQGPIKQSDRLDSYKKYAHILVEKGLAYPDPFTEAEVEEFRKKAEAEKRPFLYRDHRPTTFDIWDGTKPLRFKVPEIKRYEWHDEVRGTLSAGEEALDDFILLKGDGYPTYNFAHIIDDLEMEVTHIMRGEEFISSTPKFLSLYDALEITPPKIATMPVILGPDGKKKLSKRDGAKDILDYRSEGYLPDALFNFLALLGWHPEDDREVLSKTELMEAFTLERIQKGGAKFDEAKLLWFNHEHLEKISPKEFTRLYENFSGEKLQPNLTPLLQERARTFAEAKELKKEYTFLESANPSKDLLLKGAKVDAETASMHLQKTLGFLEPLSETEFTAEKVKEVVFPYATDVGRGAVLWPMRVALSGMEKSPDPFVLAELIGKKASIERLQAALIVLK